MKLSQVFQRPETSADIESAQLQRLLRRFGVERKSGVCEHQFTADEAAIIATALGYLDRVLCGAEPDDFARRRMAARQ